MHWQSFVDEIVQQGISHSTLQKHAENAAISAAQLLDQAALFIAREYFAKRMPFDEADLIINNVWCLATGLDTGLSHVVHTVYLAFDGGEYRRSGEDPDVNPEYKYTLPAIKEFLSQYPQG